MITEDDLGYCGSAADIFLKNRVEKKKKVEKERGKPGQKTLQLKYILNKAASKVGLFLLTDP